MAARAGELNPRKWGDVRITKLAYDTACGRVYRGKAEESELETSLSPLTQSFRHSNTFCDVSILLQNLHLDF